MARGGTNLGVADHSAPRWWKAIAVLPFLVAWHVEVALRGEAPARWFDKPTRRLLNLD